MKKLDVNGKYLGFFSGVYNIKASSFTEALNDKLFETLYDPFWDTITPIRDRLKDQLKQNTKL